ncbi:MAG: glucosamine-6-phosphate deaminase [Nanoarchaeota archaeon]|nr:glucosamine-6-phosphate deaminase [Nanoarchaeota archaeon]MBU1051721.1 glucosamine-6-phosphate deaminase [Nanoarchaeota archaeon]MBU1988659.1 glucosamine-6-phosphate deaminase [Nanoarchaeota archaeon]
MKKTKKRGIEVLVFAKEKEVAEEVAGLITKEIRKKSGLRLGLATGKTMIPVYRELVKLYKKKKVNFSKVKIFSLDEYVGTNKMRNYLEKNFFSKVNVSRSNINLLDGKARNLNLECKRYEKDIGRLDLQILGIGRNGHIGFNEPGSGFRSNTRKIKLERATLKDKGKFPEFALTIGIGTILRANKILLVGFGKSKSETISSALDKMSKKIPASALQRRKNVLFVLDKQAGKNLK